MQAGFTYRPIIARRDGTQTEARVGDGRVCLRELFSHLWPSPAAGRLLTDADDLPGAPPTAVMSYETWQHELCRRSRGGRQHLLGEHQAGDRCGHRAAGFYGDRLTSTPPDFYLPIETMPLLANAPYVHEPDDRLALHDRAASSRVLRSVPCRRR